MPYLIHKDKDGSVIQFWNLHDGPITIGRGDDSNGKVDDELLSRAHFTVAGEPGSFTIKDLGSKNGTLVNGQKVSQQVLKMNDQIRAGQSNFSYVDGLTTMASKIDEDIRQLEKMSPKSPK